MRYIRIHFQVPLLVPGISFVASSSCFMFLQTLIMMPREIFFFFPDFPSPLNFIMISVCHFNNTLKNRPQFSMFGWTFVESTEEQGKDSFTKGSQRDFCGSFIQDDANQLQGLWAAHREARTRPMQTSAEFSCLQFCVTPHSLTIMFLPQGPIFAPLRVT